MFLVYLITNLVNEKVYVGKTFKGLPFRWKKHREAANSGTKTHLYAAVRKYGPENFSITEISQAETEDEINDLEKIWIILLNSKNRSIGYNMTDGGDGRTGIKDSEETRQLKSFLAKGRLFSDKAKWRQKEVRATKVGDNAIHRHHRISSFDVLDLYNTGASSREVARILGVEKSLIAYRVEEVGGVMRQDSKAVRLKKLEQAGKTHLLILDDKEIKKKYLEDGKTLDEIGVEYLISRKCIKQRLLKQGVIIRPRGQPKGKTWRNKQTQTALN